jgi:hypothetical protein
MDVTKGKKFGPQTQEKLEKKLMVASGNYDIGRQVK